jgi:hypothetical protein
MYIGVPSSSPFGPWRDYIARLSEIIPMSAHKASMGGVARPTVIRVATEKFFLTPTLRPSGVSTGQVNPQVDA